MAINQRQIAVPAVIGGRDQLKAAVRMDDGTGHHIFQFQQLGHRG